MGTKPLLGPPRHCLLRSGLGAAFATLFLATACSPGTPTTEPFSVTDSAGITIVENESPQWTNDGWTIAEEPEWVFGKDGMSQDGVSLQHITAIRPMSNERIAILDRGSKQVFVLGALGQLLDVFGGEGDGPGELQRPRSLHVCGDTLFIQHNARIDRFTGTSGYVAPVEGWNVPLRELLQGASVDCSLLLFADVFGKRGSLEVSGNTVSTVPLSWFDPAGDRVALLFMDSTFGVRVTITPDGAIALPQDPPWTAYESRVVSDTFVIQGVARRPELRWHLPSGRTTKVVRWSQAAVPVTQVDKGRYSEKRRVYIHDYGSHPDIFFAFPELTLFEGLPSIKPYFDEVQVDDADYVWVRVSSGGMGYWEQVPPHRKEPPQRWFVFDPTGRWLGEVTMPSNFTLHAVADGRAVGVMKDELDVQTVRAYRIERN